MRHDHLTTPDGTRLAYRVHSPTRRAPAQPPVLLLHGLAGPMAEWDALTEHLLQAGHEVIAYDARGHGASTRRPPTMTRSACVSDAVTLLNHLSLAPATLIGQSLGGHTALLTAAAHPDSVSSLILIEAGPGGPNPTLPTQITTWLNSWPAPSPPSRKRRPSWATRPGREAWSSGRTAGTPASTPPE
ncbi:alpha/beta fold hydrolase [Streptomyces sp. NPDC052687]|uniref:alpha/beta fold hydrolase n=1 Tax=Streptomyces sp. NPDC052687 TaxID=3154759 RepID=UPI00341AB9EB